LQTKVVDAQENPPAIISAAKLYEVQKYCSLTNHMWDGWWFLINRRAWQAVPRDIQEIVAKNVNAAALAEREDVAKQNVSLKRRNVLGVAQHLGHATETATFDTHLRPRVDHSA
jgi:TRAP-type transport system periplasmic protein